MTRRFFKLVIDHLKYYKPTNREIKRHNSYLLIERNSRVKIESYQSHKHMKLTATKYNYVGEQRKFFLLFYFVGLLGVTCYILWPYEWYKIPITAIIATISILFFIVAQGEGYIKSMTIDNESGQWHLSLVKSKNDIKNLVLNTREIETIYLAHYGNIAYPSKNLNITLHIEMTDNYLPLASKKDKGPILQIEGMDSHSKILDFAKRLAQISNLTEVTIEHNDPYACVICLSQKSQPQKLETLATTDLHAFYQKPIAPAPQLQKIVCPEWNPQQSEILEDVEYTPNDTLIIKNQQPQLMTWLVLLLIPLIGGIFSVLFAFPYFFFFDIVFKFLRQLLPFFIGGYAVTFFVVIFYIIHLKKQQFFAPTIHHFNLQKQTLTITNHKQCKNFDLRDVNKVILSLHRDKVRSQRQNYRFRKVYFAVVLLSGLEKQVITVGQTKNYSCLSDAYKHGLHFASVFCKACDKNLTLWGVDSSSVGK